jgi:hypothetical protein
MSQTTRLGVVICLLKVPLGRNLIYELPQKPQLLVAVINLSCVIYNQEQWRVTMSTVKNLSQIKDYFEQVSLEKFF